MSEEKRESLSRREFLKNTGVFAAGALAAGGVLAALNPSTAEAAYQALPWPYNILDLNVVRQRAYNNYYVGGCMYGAASALITTLIEVVGSPWDTLPLDMFKYGKGGAFGWGTVCGALNGSSYVLQLAGGTNADKAIYELFGWYTKYPFPSKLMDAYAKYTKQKTTVCYSPLCHQSASIWCYETKNKYNSDPRKDRCAKVAGDTAAKAAEIMNSIVLGTFTPVYQPDPEFNRCLDCHVGSTSVRDDAQGYANCIKCHDDKVNHYP